MDPASLHLRRRRFLGGALGLLAAGGGVVLQQSSGYADLPGVRRALLSTKEGAVLAAAFRRVLASDDGPPDDAATASAVTFLDGYLGRQEVWVQREVRALLLLIEHGGLLLAGGLSRFTRRGPDAQDAVLRALATSRVTAFRQGYQAIKGLALMAGYRQAAFLRATGYDGPASA